MGPIMPDGIGAIGMAPAADQSYALTPLRATNGASLLHGCAPGPGATKGPTRAAWALASTRAQTLCGVRPCRLRLRPSAPFCALRVPCCAGAPAPARVPFGAGRPRPLRGSGPAPSALPSVALPGPGPFPPAPPLGPCAPQSRLRGRSLAPLCFGLGLAVLRASFGRPCAVSALPRALRGILAGSPLGPPLAGLRPSARLRRRAASGPAAPARGPARPFGPLVVGLRPPGCGLRPLFLRRGLLRRPRC